MTKNLPLATKNQLMIGYFVLILTAILWGSAFIFQKNASEQIDAFTFNFFRFGIAIFPLLLLKRLPNSFFASDQNQNNSKKITHKAWFIGVVAGGFMFLGISFQQLGLTYTTAGKSGFLTALYIICVPFLALFIGQKTSLNSWVGAVLCILGIFVLSGGDLSLKQDINSATGINIGDVYTLICALFWGGQVLWLGLFAKYGNILTISILQALTVCLLSFISMIINSLWFSSDSTFLDSLLPSLSLLNQIKWDLIYTGVISSAFAFTLQIYGQRYIPPTNAAIIMSTEAVFAFIGGVLFLNEVVSLAMFLGCCTIFSGIVVAQMTFKRKKPSITTA